MKEIIASTSTKQLIEMSLMLADKLGTDETYVSAMIDRELERRLPEAEFLAHMDRLEAILDAAMTA